MSQLREIGRRRGCCRAHQRAAAQTSTVPRPGALSYRKAYTFAGRGISVVCLAIYKARQSEVYLLQTKRRFKTYGIIDLLGVCWSGLLDCRIKWDAAGGARFGPALSRNR